MIDFRYHLVSIVAIFLSLAVGLVLGATALQDPLLDSLKKQAGDAAKSSEEWRNRTRQLQGQIDGEERFAQVLGPQIVADRLRGESVVLVETPGANADNLDKVANLAKTAGATVTGKVTVQKKFLDDDQAQTLDALADQTRPAGLTFQQGATTYDKAGAVLATALVTKDLSRAGREDASSGEILAAFKEAGYVTSSGKPGQHATLAVVIAPSAPYSYEGADADNKALLSLATALDGADRGTLIGGPLTTAGDGGLIAALRDSDDADTISSVDSIDTSSGQIVAILALETETTGKAGQYGTGPGAGGYLPATVPTPGAAG